MTAIRILRDQPAPNALLITSPLTFFFPIYIAELLGYTAYSRALQLVIATSFWYHSSYSKPAYIADQLAIAACEVAGFAIAWQTHLFGLTIFSVTNAYTIYMYFYGKVTQTLAFERDMFAQSWFHASIHFLAALAHTILLLKHWHLTHEI
jgi:hypothetical protein